MENLTNVSKSDFQIFKFNGGYYGICPNDSHGGDCIAFGDSADEDSYNLELVTSTFELWNGQLFNGVISIESQFQKAKVYRVTYTKAIGGVGFILVKAQDEKQALNNAANSCYTGKDFRNAEETQEFYEKPSKQGFQGPGRINNTY